MTSKIQVFDITLKELTDEEIRNERIRYVELQIATESLVTGCKKYANTLTGFIKTSKMLETNEDSRNASIDSFRVKASRLLKKSER